MYYNVTAMKRDGAGRAREKLIGGLDERTERKLDYGKFVI